MQKSTKNTTAKRVNTKPALVAASNVTESKPDPRAERAERLAADRKAVASLYAGFDANRSSVPVKALSGFKPTASTAHPISRNPSMRQAAAILTAFAASGNKLADGASAPRVFDINGVRSCIENGAMRDAISSGLISVSGATPETETLRILPGKAAAIAGIAGEKLAKLAGYVPGKAA